MPRSVLVRVQPQQVVYVQAPPQGQQVMYQTAQQPVAYQPAPAPMYQAAPTMQYQSPAYQPTVAAAPAVTYVCVGLPLHFQLASVLFKVLLFLELRCMNRPLRRQPALQVPPPQSPPPPPPREWRASFAPAVFWCCSLWRPASPCECWTRKAQSKDVARRARLRSGMYASKARCILFVTVRVTVECAVCRSVLCCCQVHVVSGGARPNIKLESVKFPGKYLRIGEQKHLNGNGTGGGMSHSLSYC
jgi:hypothetical protein